MIAATALLGLAAVLLSAATLAQNQTHITVLYESHCPDSRNFIRELVLLWGKLEPHCTLELVPFGKARSIEGGGFVCQHGQKECRGNMIMSCAINRLPAGRKHLEFVGCFMEEPDNLNSSCAERSGLQWEDINSCMESGEGTRLQQEAEQNSNSIRISRFVPTIMLDRVYNPTVQDKSTTGHFGEVMSEYLNNPDVCQ